MVLVLKFGWSCGSLLKVGRPYHAMWLMKWLVEIAIDSSVKVERWMKSWNGISRKRRVMAEGMEPSQSLNVHKREKSHPWCESIGAHNLLSFLTFYCGLCIMGWKKEMKKAATETKYLQDSVNCGQVLVLDAHQILKIHLFDRFTFLVRELFNQSFPLMIEPNFYYLD